MKTLILTAINDNYPFWYKHFIPFILSLQQTDYAGDIGVIAYDLSAAKQEVLHKNGILVFPATHRFGDLTIDRQYTTAVIAEQYGYDKIALYDTDIWFPNTQLTIFDCITEHDKIYASYDVSCADFIFACVREYGIERVRDKLNQVMQKNGGYPWQVGVLAAYQQGWQNYRAYLDTLLAPTQFDITYGVDTTAFNLYDADTAKVAHLPERYNCLPYWGLKISNINTFGKKRQPENCEFTLNGENVEGIHVAGNLRRWGRCDYDYDVYHAQHFFSEGKKYRPFACETKAIPTQILSDAYPPRPNENLPILQVQSIHIENSISTMQDNHDIVIQVTGCSQFTLYNPNPYPVVLEATHQAVLHRLPCRGASIIHRDRSWDFKYANHHNYLQTIALQSGDKLEFLTYDLDPQYSHSQWLIRGIRLIS